MNSAVSRPTAGTAAAVATQGFKSFVTEHKRATTPACCVHLPGTATTAMYGLCNATAAKHGRVVLYGLGRDGQVVAV